MPTFDLSKLRVGKFGIRESFEEFCCQLFRRAESKEHWKYRRISGRGGDGGVEAVWEKPDGDVWGLQAKYFFKLGPSEKTQMKESLDQALANYGSLTHYTYAFPATLTGKKGAKAKRQTVGEHGEPWFVAKDVAVALGYTDTDQAIRKHCKRANLLKSVESTV